MPTLKGLLGILLLLGFFACSDDNTTIDTIQYSWPVWSSDNGFVVAEYRQNPQDQDLNAPATIVVHYSSDNSELYVSVAKLDPSAPIRLWVPQDTNVIILGNSGLRVLDLDGNIKNDKVVSTTGVSPTVIAIARSGSSFYWGVTVGGKLQIGYVSEYESGTFVPVVESIIYDTTTSANIEDIVETSENNCAVLLSNGTVVTVSRVDGMAKLYGINPISIDGAGYRRLHYLKSMKDEPTEMAPDFLYYIDAGGMGRINLVSDAQSTLLPAEPGHLLNISLDAATRTLLFVTAGKQVWLASENSSPIQVLLFGHTMAALSPDGKSVAAVEYLNGLQNKLNILKFRP